MNPSMSKPNILFIVHRLPFPLNSGGKQAIFNGIDAVKENCNVVITFIEDPSKDTPQKKKAFLEAVQGKAILAPLVRTAPAEHFAKVRPALLLRILTNLKHRLHPHQDTSNPCRQWVSMLQPQPADFVNHVKSLITEYDIDIVQCEMLVNLSFVRTLPQHVKTLFVHHELGFVRHELELRAVYSSYHGEAFAAEAKRQEIGLLNSYDHVMTLSTIDRQKLLEAGVSSPISSSFAIVKAHPDVSGIATDPHHLSFIGSDSHEPNLMGLQWFLDKCWPSLIKADPAYHLTIIGKWSAHNSSDLASRYPAVSFAGFVDDLPSTLCGTVMIVPITIGSGIRMKILEASGMGVPFVSTTIGAEGLPVEHNKHCKIADLPEDFVLAILALQDDKQRQCLIDNARQLITQRYSTDALRQNRLNIYQSLLHA